MLFVSFFFLFGFSNDFFPVYNSYEINESVFSVKKNLDCSNEDFLNAGTFTPKGKTSDSIASYNSEKAASKHLRKKLFEDLALKNVSMDAVKSSFTNHLVNRLIPHWYGTEWSFGGHTATPKEGKIACGYFISTTLRHMGLRLNRYQLAQKSPIDEAKMLSCGAEVKTITAKNSELAIQQIDKFTKEGISFIGFDNGHVGFILKQKGELFLVHSNYLFPNAVCMERIEESIVFKTFSTFHLVEISNNDLLIQRWLDDVEIL